MQIEIQRDTLTVPFNKHCQFCVGSPHAAYALRRDYYEQLNQAGRERAGIVYGRNADDL